MTERPEMGLLGDLGGGIESSPGPLTKKPFLENYIVYVACVIPSMG